MTRPSHRMPVATARLIAPQPPLASCLRACVVRDTTGIAPLPPAQRLNHFPATVHCSLSWVVAGSTQLASGEAMPRAALGGPQTRPRTSSNPGPVHVFIALFYPQALHAMTGLDISQHVDRFVPLEQALGADWQDLSRRMLEAPDDEGRAALLAQFLAPRWQQARESGAAPGNVVGDWVNSLAAQVAASGWGRSVRNIERRIKVWAGQPLRRMRRFSRAERQFREIRPELDAGSLSWADAAARGGYADQAHLSRETRAVTGLSPTELARRLQDDESYWVYRIWS